jgi:hypothetical protein
MEFIALFTLPGRELVADASDRPDESAVSFKLFSEVADMDIYRPFKRGCFALMQYVHQLIA